MAGHLCEWYKDETQENYWYAYSNKGYNNHNLMMEYLVKVFEPSTKPKYKIHKLIILNRKTDKLIVI